MSIQLAIIIELLLIASLVIVWLKDNNLFKKIQRQIIEMQEEIDAMEQRNSFEIASALRKFKTAKAVPMKAPAKKVSSKKKK